jgi:hypothetical protein
MEVMNSIEQVFVDLNLVKGLRKNHMVKVIMIEILPLHESRFDSGTNSSPPVRMISDADSNGRSIATL